MISYDHLLLDYTTQMRTRHINTRFSGPKSTFRWGCLQKVF